MSQRNSSPGTKPSSPAASSLRPAPGPAQRWFLALASLAFVAWLGWLLYLTLISARPIVLSRPQLLVSNLDVIAEVHQEEGHRNEVKVREVHWPQSEAAKALEGRTITVANLSDSEGWTGPGVYILPLVADFKGRYEVAHTPPSPGFDPSPIHPAGRPHIYPLTPQTRRQLEQIAKPQGAEPAE